MSRRRLAAAASLVLGLVAVALAIDVALHSFPRGLAGVVLFVLAAAAAWQGVIRRGPVRALALALAGLLMAGALVVVVTRQPLLTLAAVAAVWLALGAARIAFSAHVTRSPAPRPAHPVLFYNPRSGGGKAERFHVADEARERGIEPIELAPGTDLEQLVLTALEGGADALAMAGGDGSQAVVARMAAERGLPYACIPAGTRNHFALDLGVDRDDVVGALDAFVDGGERLVDLAEVNDRVFVNNVSLGLYANAVQEAGYREAKLRTLLDAVPGAVEGLEAPDLHWEEPDGDDTDAGLALLVSNNRYRLGRMIASGTRPRLDEGVLGVTVLGRPRAGGGDGDRSPWRGWTTPSFDVEAGAPVPAGIDGEAVVLEAPLRFRMRPGALRCRIAQSHPGASPSAFVPEGLWDGIGVLAGLAAGRDLQPVSPRRVAGHS